MSKLRAGIYASLVLLLIIATSILFIFDPKATTAIICLVGVVYFIWNAVYINFIEKE